MRAPTLLICRDARDLAARAADFIVECARRALGQRERFTLVLAGGSTPEATYALLAQAERAAAIDWKKTCVFFGDERFVPPDDPRSNFAIAQRTLLVRVPLPAAQVFPIPTRTTSAAESATVYAAELASFFSLAADGPPPRFDLILLGLGEDGHTASLFPGAPALYVDDAWVTWSGPGAPPPAVDRITMTYPVLNGARHVAFLAAGEKKAAAVRDVLERRASREDRPAAGVQPAHGMVTWLIDEGAAKLLTRNREARTAAT